MGRHVGVRLTSGRYVLCVDGDTEIDPGWVSAALAVLSTRPDLAGVAGREDQIYYQNGVATGGRADYFETGDVECSVDQFGGNALYRRAALEAVGSFNPFVRSFEEAELGARLRNAGWRLSRIPVRMAAHHTQTPDSVDEYWRRVRTHLFTGHGQVLRIAIRQGLFWEHARRLNRVLLFMLWSAVGCAALVASVALSRVSPIATWLLVTTAFMAAFVIRSRSLSKPFQMVFDWAVCSLPLAWGLLLNPDDPARLRLEEIVVSDHMGGADAAPVASAAR
jgi:cellulose synthase/poly-beta-1,6-N-acetylglucosamine synthase-like glycosyltransferase